MRVKVTRKDISRGQRESKLSHPIALAMRRETEGLCFVDKTRAWVGAASTTVPPRVQEWMARYESGRPVRPITFGLAFPVLPQF